MNNNKYRIAATPNSWDIQERRVVKTGKNAGTEHWVPFKFCGTIEYCAKRLLDILTREKLKDGHSTQDLIDAIRDAEKNVLEAVRAIEMPCSTQVLEKPVKTVHAAQREDLKLVLAEPSKKMSKRRKK